MRRAFATLLVLGVLAGCVSVGTNYNTAAVGQLQPGLSKEEVIARLGPPNSRSTTPTGEEVMVWLHSTGTALGTGRARSVTLLFDASGHFVRVLNTTETQIR